MPLTGMGYFGVRRNRIDGVFYGAEGQLAYLSGDLRAALAGANAPVA